MNFFQINACDHIDLYKIELIRVLPESVSVFSCGREYCVAPDRAQELLDKMKMIEQGSALGDQHVAM